MKQNMVIVAILLIAVVVIAVVLMVNQPKPQFPVGPGALTTPGSTTIPSDIAGNAVSCEVAISGTVGGVQKSGSGTIKIEDPKKMNVYVSSSSQGQEVIMRLIVNGDMGYIYLRLPTGEESWVKIDASKIGSTSGMEIDAENIKGKRLDEIEEMIKDGVTSSPSMKGLTTTVSCKNVADIPEAEFSLPPGVVAKDLNLP